VIDARNVLLRAERSGTGPGRTYDVTIACVDAKGQEVRRTLTVQVPHSAR